MPAGQLGIGTSIVTRAGPALTVSGVQLLPEQVGGYTVYNLTVEGDHTYFVGSIGGGAWVHNNICTEEQNAIDVVLGRVDRGEAHPYAQDGTTFKNRPVPGRATPELPVQPEGYYSEYTVPTPGIATRGQRRLVLGSGGEVYYTINHYNSFVQTK